VTYLLVDRWYLGRVLRRIFGQKRDEVTGGWRKLHNEKLHNLFSWPSIIRMITSRRIRWARHVARIARREMHVGYWCKRQKERDHLDDRNVGGWIILEPILEMWDAMVWTGLICLRTLIAGGGGDCDQGSEPSGFLELLE
jgi:hypothetical protein